LRQFARLLASSHQLRSNPFFLNTLTVGAHQQMRADATCAQQVRTGEIRRNVNWTRLIVNPKLSAWRTRHQQLSFAIAEQRVALFFVQSSMSLLARRI
jgi:hypothetical protein